MARISRLEPFSSLTSMTVVTPKSVRIDLNENRCLKIVNSVFREFSSRTWTDGVDGNGENGENSSLKLGSEIIFLLFILINAYRIIPSYITFIQNKVSS